jgi:hypothetical protein
MLKTLEMTRQSSLRTPQSTDAVRTGIHLVHSRAWAHDRRPIAPAPQQQLSPRRLRERHPRAVLGLASVALSLPLVWIGHAILHSMQIL